jgi:uncharacterized protein
MTLGVALEVVVFGVVVGVVSALFGVGGGIIMVPFMVLVLGTSQQIAEGTSLLVIIPTSLAGFVAHRRQGFGSIRHAALLGVGGVCGSFAGASIALSLSAGMLQTFFGALVIAVGIRLIVQGRALWS